MRLRRLLRSPGALYHIWAQRQPLELAPVPEGTDLEKLLAWEATCAWPEAYYSVTTSLVAALRPKIFVEIGVAYGYHARRILAASEDTQYIGIDPYAAGYDPTDLFCRDVGRLFECDDWQEAMDRLCAVVSASLGTEFGGRASLVRSASSQAVDKVASDIDMVFVDGDHRAHAVASDIAGWWPKLAPGGVMLGDDLDWPETRGVVKDMAQDLGVSPIEVRGLKSQHAMWLLIKPRT